MLTGSGTPIIKNSVANQHRYGLDIGAALPLGIHSPTTPLLSAYLLKAALPQLLCYLLC